MKESAVASHIRLAGAQLGVDLWRNNVGVLFDENGRPVRYGLANDSPAMNKTIKSSDLIGITPVIVTPAHVGRLLGVFTAVETKASDWTLRPSDAHALAQAAFHDIVRAAGGFAGFARNVQEFRGLVGK
jgi:hypothetical protein